MRWHDRHPSFILYNTLLMASKACNEVYRAQIVCCVTPRLTTLTAPAVRLSCVILMGDNHHPAWDSDHSELTNHSKLSHSFGWSDAYCRALKLWLVSGMCYEREWSRFPCSWSLRLVSFYCISRTFLWRKYFGTLTHLKLSHRSYFQTQLHASTMSMI